MDIFHHNLEPVEASCFRKLNLTHEVHRQVFVYYSIAGREEGQDMGNKMALTIIQGGPVLQVAAKIYLFGCPEAGFVLFVHLPNLWIVDGKDYKTILVLSQ